MPRAPWYLARKIRTLGDLGAMWGPPGYVTLGAEPGGSRIALSSSDVDAAQGFLS